MAPLKIWVKNLAKMKAIEKTSQNIYADAGQMRRQKLALRREMTEEKRWEASDSICGQIKLLPQWKRAAFVLCYASYDTEVSTYALISSALSEGKKVYCPKVEGDGRMEFYRITSLEDLIPGYRGILEPDGTTEVFRPAESGGKISGCGQEAPHALYDGEVLLLAPGTAFDLQGHRIGYGGGYYDRWLARFGAESRPFCIGLAFGCQLCPEIVPQSHDFSMDMVLTESVS